MAKEEIKINLSKIKLEGCFTIYVGHRHSEHQGFRILGYYQNRLFLRSFDSPADFGYLQLSEEESKKIKIKEEKGDYTFFHNHYKWKDVVKYEDRVERLKKNSISVKKALEEGYTHYLKYDSYLDYNIYTPTGEVCEIKEGFEQYLSNSNLNWNVDYIILHKEFALPDNMVTYKGDPKSITKDYKFYVYRGKIYDMNKIDLIKAYQYELDNTWEDEEYNFPKLVKSKELSDYRFYHSSPY